MGRNPMKEGCMIHNIGLCFSCYVREWEQDGRKLEGCGEMTSKMNMTGCGKSFFVRMKVLKEKGENRTEKQMNTNLMVMRMIDH